MGNRPDPNLPPPKENEPIIYKPGKEVPPPNPKPGTQEPPKK